MDLNKIEASCNIIFYCENNVFLSFRPAEARIIKECPRAPI